MLFLVAHVEFLSLITMNILRVQVNENMEKSLAAVAATSSGRTPPLKGLAAVAATSSGRPPLLKKKKLSSSSSNK